MSILDWFAKKEKSQTVSEKLNIPSDLWVKCTNCSETLYLRDLEGNFKVCTKCHYHFRLSPEERIRYFLDEESFEESNQEVVPTDFLGFVDTEKYQDRIKKTQAKLKKTDAVITGVAKIDGVSINIALMDFSFMGGSMGSVVGEKITRVIEQALKNRFPVIIFSSSGGARMQEGAMSLMQMAKTSGALAKLDDAGILYISILCDPTTGGTSASFAMLGDIHLAEPGAFISFAGPRVIEQTIRQKLPKGFQRSEFLLQKGMVDRVVPRHLMKQTLTTLISVLCPEKKKEMLQ